MIEYLCTGEYSPGCEAGISPLADDIDWSICDAELKQRFDILDRSSMLISDKDRNAYTVSQWQEQADSDRFIYGRL